MSSETDLNLPEKTSSNNFLQIDILKGIMIMLVIIDHAIPTIVRAEWGHSLWERISIPVFLIIMGFNVANSFKKNDVPLSSFKSYLQYCWHKIKRYLIPFAFLYLISTIFGLIRYGGFESLLQGQFDGHWPREFLWYFIYPFYGPGNWFIPVLVQSAIIMPFLYWGYKKSPKITLALSVIWEIGIQYFVFTYFGHYITWWPNYPLGRTMLQVSILFYLNAIVLGFWFADHQDLGSGSVLPEQKIQDVTPDENKGEIQDETQEESQKTSKIFLEILKKIWSFHFYIVLITAILISTIVIMPIIDQNGEPGQSTGFTILIIFLIIGLYFYRPLWEFLIIFIVSVGMVIGFNYLIHCYRNNADLNLILGTIEPAVGLFFLSVAFFIIPYLVNIFYSPKNKNWFIWVLFMMSGTYLIYYQYAGFRYLLLVGDYHFLVYPYSALIVLLFLKMIPKKSNFVLFKGFAYVGKATYHILLTQIFAYGILLSTFGEHYFQGDLMIRFEDFPNQFLFEPSQYYLSLWIYVLIMWAICIPIGILWYLIEKFVFSYIKKIIIIKKKKRTNPNILDS